MSNFEVDGPAESSANAADCILALMLMPADDREPVVNNKPRQYETERIYFFHTVGHRWVSPTPPRRTRTKGLLSLNFP